ncbi:MBOAT, membrane-bound O-acyltransferase family-domain-containing protein, partial [Entophlyctis helioformis]
MADSATLLRNRGAAAAKTAVEASDDNDDSSNYVDEPGAPDASAGDDAHGARNGAAAAGGPHELRRPRSRQGSSNRKHNPHSHTQHDKHHASNGANGSAPFSHTYLIHTSVRASPLSKDSPEQNYRGFFNLSMLLLGVSNLRLIIENFMKYGWLLNFPKAGLKLNDIKWSLVSMAFQLVPILVAFLIEKWAAYASSASIRTGIAPSLPAARVLNTVNVCAALFVPAWISWSMIWSPVSASAPLFTSIVLFLKLVSYALVNSDLRRESVLKVHLSPVQDDTSFTPTPLTDTSGEKFDPNHCPYPANITLNNLVYFCLAPTLSYQPVYPRTKRIRKVFLMKRFIELSTALAGMFFLSIQYAAPTLQNSIEALDKFDIPRLVERVLKLSIVSVVIWLLMFWSFFHCWLNILAEVLRFGDRRFYEPWWNARDISEYWRLWNTPVYYWGKRHVYLPLIRTYRVHPTIAMAAVFTVSAVLHELVVGIPTHSLNGTAFIGMLGQIPLIFCVRAIMSYGRRLLKRPKNDQLFDTIGNYLFWITFTIVGQPACVLVYYSQWYKQNVKA